MNHLIKKLKVRKAVNKYIFGVKPVTVFRKLVFEKQANKAKKLKSAYYEIFEGTFYNYQLPLDKNEQVVLLSHNKTKQ